MLWLGGDLLGLATCALQGAPKKKTPTPLGPRTQTNPLGQCRMHHPFARKKSSARQTLD